MMNIDNAPNEYQLMDDANSGNADYRWVRDVSDDDNMKRIVVDMWSYGHDWNVVASLETVDVFSNDVEDSKELAEDVEDSEAFEAAFDFMASHEEW